MFEHPSFRMTTRNWPFRETIDYYFMKLSLSINYPMVIPYQIFIRDEMANLPILIDTQTLTFKDQTMCRLLSILWSD